MYSLQLNCTYSNYTEAFATFSAVQQHSTFTVQNCTKCTDCNWTVLTVNTEKLLLHVQLHNRRETVKLMTSVVEPAVYLIWYGQSHPNIRSFKFTLLAASAVSQLDSDKEQVNVTKLNDTQCKLKGKLNIVSMTRKYVCKFSVFYPLYSIFNRSRPVLL